MWKGGRSAQPGGLHPGGSAQPQGVCIKGGLPNPVGVCTQEGSAQPSGVGVCPGVGSVSRGVCPTPPSPRSAYRGVGQAPLPPPPLWTEWHTGVKTLPCPKLRLRAVTKRTHARIHCESPMIYLPETLDDTVFFILHQQKLYYRFSCHGIHQGFVPILSHTNSHICIEMPNVKSWSLFHTSMNIELHHFTIRKELPCCITSNYRPFGCPIIYTDTNSQCCFVHRHPQQCLTQQCSFANWDAMFYDNC